jgi:spermidine synthase
MPVVTGGLRYFLYITAAFTGGAILVLEILGAKMLAPYFGTSHFVWTAQIAVTLVALAAGYYGGGWLVDRQPRLSRLYLCVLAAALYLCLVVRIIRPLADACLRFELAWAALLVSATLFFVPLTLLATTGPFLVRILTTSMNTVGGQVGRLSSISTLGSVGGTVLIGYVLIPHLPNSMTLYLTALVLGLLGLLYFVVWGRREGGLVVPGILALLGALLAYSGWHQETTAVGDMDELYRCNSPFGLMQVCQARDGALRYYLNDYLVQNTMDTETRKSLSLFTYMLHGLAKAHTPKLQSALCIGLGVGIVPMSLARGGAQVDVVEINPAVVPLASRFFDLDPQRLNLFIGDGRYFLNRCQKQYDTIILDAFLGDSSPSHLMTREAFALMHRALGTNGTLVINSFGDFESGRDFFMASLDRTLREVFRSVRMYSASGVGNGNVFFVASDQTELVQLGEPDLTEVHPYCHNRVIEAWKGIRQVDDRHGRVLTDDFNPVDYYDGLNRMDLRRSLALSMRASAN